MPDLATHLLIPGIVSLLRKFKNWPLFLLGNILPDLLGRSFNYLLRPFNPYIGDVMAPFHSLLVVPLYAYAVTLLFHSPLRNHVFKLLLAGSYLHMGLDSFQTHVGTGNLLLFPLYTDSLEIPVFWPEASLYAVPPLVVLFVIIFVRRYRHMGAGK